MPSKMIDRYHVTADALNWSTNTDEQFGFWQQYNYNYGYGSTSIIFRCSICNFHPCDHNLGEYKFCPRCGTPMVAPPGPVIEIDTLKQEVEI